MKYLLDTCVLSDGAKGPVDASLLRWLDGKPEENRFVSVLSLAEILFGILRLPDGRRKIALADWYDKEMRPFYEARVLPFGEAEAIEWARLRAVRPNAAQIDAQIAATALVHGLTLVTRNVKDFEFEGLNVLNPWRG